VQVAPDRRERDIDDGGVQEGNPGAEDRYSEQPATGRGIEPHVVLGDARVAVAISGHALAIVIARSRL
jgi:hypothetical protein